MATDIVQTLFGITPEGYERQQAAAADQRALALAQLTPMQRAEFNIGRGAYQLAGALGGPDPELARVSMRQALARQINFNDPTSIQEGVQALAQAGDTQGAMMLADTARKALESGALVRQRLREGAAKDPLQELLRSGKYTPESVRAYASTGDISQLKLAEKEQNARAFGVEREAVARELYGKPFAELTQTEIAAVNKRVEAAKPSTTITNVLPGQKQLVDIPEFRAKVQKTIEPQSKAVFAADNALTAIEDSLKTNNFISFNAARTQLAKALGDSQLSRRDVEQAGGDPSILGRLSDVTSTLFTGTPTVDTQNKIKQTLEAIRTVASDKARQEISRQRNIALRSPGYAAEAVDAALDFPEFAPRAAAVAARVTPADQALLDKYAPRKP